MPETDEMLRELSRRERQIMDFLYRHGRATAAEVQAGIPDAPGYSAVRAMLRILEDKGHVRHEERGPRYVFSPVVSRARARRFGVHSFVRAIAVTPPCVCALRPPA